MEITGKLLECLDTVQVSERFRIREFILEYADNPEYPEYIKFELAQERCELLDPFQPGQKVRVEFDLKGRRWTDPQGQVKYFNSLRAWRLNEVSSETSTPPDPSGGSEDIPLPENLGPPKSDEIPF